MENDLIGSVRFSTKSQRSKILVVWACLWALGGMVHSTQGIWNSAWNDYLGDEIDGRLNNLILEHGYQSILGVYDFESPGQFAPTRGTIAYSDMHLGTLPLYVVGRLVGLSVEGAYQWWTIGIVSLNGLALMALLRALKIPWLLVGPLVFMGASPASFVAFAGTHIQVIPLFALSLAMLQWVRFFDDWNLKHLFYGLGFWGLLNLCSPYLGFFASVAACLLGLSSVILFRSEIALNSKKIWASRFECWTGGLFAFVMGVGVVWMYSLYLSQVGERGGREWELITHLSPHWKLWGMMPGGHWIYGDFFSQGESFNQSEHSLFSGLAPWIALPAAFAIRLVWKGEALAIRWQIIFAVSAFWVIMFFTRWDETGSSLYLWLARRFEGLTAFRANGRSILVIHLFQTLVLGGVLTFLYRAEGFRGMRWIAFAVALFAAFESMRFNQRSTSKEWVRARRDTVAAAWLEGNDRQLLAFAPGSYSGSPEAAHLDAWAAALKLGRKSVNGYSGSVPLEHNRFLLNPTLENAQELLKHLKLSGENCTVLESWGGKEEILGLELFGAYPVTLLNGFELQPVRWKYVFPVVEYAINGIPFHQFAPDMIALFAIPENMSRVSMLIGIREAAYTDTGNSDGVGVHWSIEVDGAFVSLVDTYLNPKENAAQRGMLEFSFDLPRGSHGNLRLKVDGGPKGDTAWDWLMIGRLRAN